MRFEQVPHQVPYSPSTCMRFMCVICRNAPHHVLGTAAAHKRLLAAAGLTVVSVQGHAWELLADETEQFMYLHNALTEAGVVLRS